MALKTLGLQTVYLDMGERVIDTFNCNNADVATRGLDVHVRKGGIVHDCTGVTLKLYIRTANRDLYESVSATVGGATGVFEVLYPEGLPGGKATGEIILSNSTETIGSFQFEVNIIQSLTSDGSIIPAPGAGILFSVISNENTRIATEAARVTAEANRVIEFDNMIAAGYIIPKSPVATFADLATTYPTPVAGWIVKTLDDGKLYRYSGTTWIWTDTVTASSYDALVIDMGDKEDLVTVDKSNLVVAVNEVSNKLEEVSVSISSFPVIIPETSDSPRIQRAIDYVRDNYGAGTVLLGALEYIIDTVIIMPNAYPITLKGVGRYESSKGTRLKYTGLGDSSIIQLNDFSQLEDMFIYNDNSETLNIIGIDCLGTLAGRTPSSVTIRNVQVKKCAIGFAFQYSWYNSFYDCYATYCDSGYRFGEESNNMGFYNCHANACKKGIDLYAGTVNPKEILFSNFSCENCTEIGIDLYNNTVVGWHFTSTYCEKNKQTARLKGQVTFDSMLINSDWTTFNSVEIPNDSPACIEIISSRGIKFDNVYFANVVTDKGFYFSEMASSMSRSVVVGNTYQGYYLAEALKNDIYGINSAFSRGYINIDRSNVKLVKSNVIDASASITEYLIPKFNDEYNGYRVVGAYLLITATIVLDETYTSFTVRFGTSGAYYDQIINYTTDTNLAVSKVKLNVIAHDLNPEYYSYKINNTRALSGKYQIVLVLSM
jgi:hypothetical protein